MASKESKKLANAQASALAAQVANMAAQLEFQKERMRLLELPQFQHLKQQDIDRLAFDKSQAEWENAFQEASVTGMYRGQPTLQYLQQQAQLFGVIDGQQTLEGKLTDAQVAQINHAMQIQSHAQLLEDQKFGFERERWGAEFDYQMQKDLRDFGLSEAQITGMYNGQQTLSSRQFDIQQAAQAKQFEEEMAFQREQLGSQNSQAYLQLLSSLQGPGNAFKQMRVLGSTPENLKQMVGQWTGQYQPNGMTGQAPGRAQVSDLFNYGGPTPVQPGVAQPGVAQPVGAVEQAGAFVKTGVAGAPAGANMVQDGAGGIMYAGGTPGWADPNAAAKKAATAMAAPTPDAAGGATGNNAPVPAGEAGYTVSPPGTQAPVDAYNYSQTPGGQTQVYPPGVAAPADQAQTSTTTPQTMLPNQINAEGYENMNKYEQEFMWGYLEDQGWDKVAAQDAYAKSLPKYGGPQQGVVNAGLGM